MAKTTSQRKPRTHLRARLRRGQARKRAAKLPKADPGRRSTRRSDKKATGVVVLDLKKAGAFTDYFVICSATNPRQVQAIADAVEEALKAQKQRPSLVEGYARAEWILLDYFDFVVHVFSKHARDFYGLDRLWGSATRIEFPDVGVTGLGTWGLGPGQGLSQSASLHTLRAAVRGVPAARCAIRSTARCARLLGQRSARAARSIDPLRRRSTRSSWACAVDRYEGRMKEIIHALKYERRRSIAPRARRADAGARRRVAARCRSSSCRCRCIRAASTSADSIRRTIWRRHSGCRSCRC